MHKRLKDVTENSDVKITFVLGRSRQSDVATGLKVYDNFSRDMNHMEETQALFSKASSTAEAVRKHIDEEKACTGSNALSFDTATKRAKEALGEDPEFKLVAFDDQTFQELPCLVDVSDLSERAADAAALHALQIQRVRPIEPLAPDYGQFLEKARGLTYRTKLAETPSTNH